MTKINIPFTDDINHIVAYGTEQSKNFYGKFDGNNKEGTFDFDSPAGRFAGEYKVLNKQIEIFFKKKPFLLPAIVIEQFLKRHIR